jgi:hypothetical protein
VSMPLAVAVGEVVLQAVLTSLDKLHVLGVIIPACLPAAIRTSVGV